MNKEYWLSRWESSNTSFHQAEVNHYLVDNFDLLNLSAGDHVFVPLCGKTADMLWLRSQQLQVTGIELSAKACEEFFIENNIEYACEQHGEYSIYQGDGIKLFCGDFFNLPITWLKKINAIYDRASLIALSPEYRQRYAEKIIEITEPEARILLISLETTKETTSPPFSVNEIDIKSLYQKNFDICQLEKFLEKTPHLLEKGYNDLLSVVYLLTRK